MYAANFIAVQLLILKERQLDNLGVTPLSPWKFCFRERSNSTSQQKKQFGQGDYLDNHTKYVFLVQVTNLSGLYFK